MCAFNAIWGKQNFFFRSLNILLSNDIKKNVYISDSVYAWYGDFVVVLPFSSVYKRWIFDRNPLVPIV